MDVRPFVALRTMRHHAGATVSRPVLVAMAGFEDWVSRPRHREGKYAGLFVAKDNGSDTFSSIGHWVTPSGVTFCSRNPPTGLQSCGYASRISGIIAAEQAGSLVRYPVLATYSVRRSG